MFSSEELAHLAIITTTSLAIIPLCVSYILYRKSKSEE